MFYHFSNRPNIKPVSAGSKFRKDKMLVTDKCGCKHLEVVGETDQYAVIQSYKEGCDINSLVESYAVTKDLRVFQRKTGSISGDATMLPKTLAEAHKMLSEAESVYNSLDPSVRLGYGDFNNFLNSVGSIDGVNRVVADVVKKPVNTIGHDNKENSVNE